MNLTYVFHQGDPVLISVFLLLAAMSLASWYIIFWKIWKLKVVHASIHAYQAHGSDAKGAVALLLKEAERLRPMLAGQDHADRKEMVSVYLAQTLDKIRVWLDRGLTILASVGSSAPFIGLFGTVWGIYGALTRIAVEGNASLNVVAGPMGEALVATAAGLFAAIPAVLAYNAFVRVNRVLVQDLRHIAEQMTLQLSSRETQ
ncbi:MAG: MotA/TolQ/ExbB proton channel family protein [Rickettsiales bacterium]|nr:MotA/TolQ/ExbB proton channel family protein [Rickettsiales bacterium]